MIVFDRDDLGMGDGVTAGVAELPHACNGGFAVALAGFNHLTEHGRDHTGQRVDDLSGVQIAGRSCFWTYPCEVAVLLAGTGKLNRISNRLGASFEHANVSGKHSIGHTANRVKSAFVTQKLDDHPGGGCQSDAVRCAVLNAIHGVSE